MKLDIILVILMKKTLTSAIYSWKNHNPEQKISHCEVSNTITVEYEQKFFVSIEESVNGQKIYLFSIIGQIPEEAKSEIALAALKGNLFGRETGHSSLGFDEATGSLILFRDLYYGGLTNDSFSDALNEFLAYRIYWEDKIHAPAQKQNATRATDKISHINQKLNVYFA